jgi:hypothetical protein
MSKLNFTKDEFDYLVDKCMFNEEQIAIFELLNKDYTRIGVLMKLQEKNLYMSERTLDRKIKKIKDKIKRVI